MIEHCISFYNKKQEDLFYRIYLTDTLMAVASNSAEIAAYCHRQGSDIKKRYYDFVEESESRKKPKKKEQTASEIIERIKGKLRKIG